MAIEFGKPNDNPSMLQMFTRYKAWANNISFEAMSEIPPAELVKLHKATFGSIIHTMNHTYVVDDIFKAHLEGGKHTYSARNTETSPPLNDLRQMCEEMDRWYIAQADQFDDRQLAEIIEFEFVGGGKGTMSRMEIFLHIVNHGTYHRGMISSMMQQIPVFTAANDLPVFLRDVWHAG
ncbi:DinB family protein [Kiloniella antarctica]|uniref:DinB family protein n=1 Tax=Kiloniella antarctica TaxID=1550907 RepID=A0ABW5BK88_9PROT